MNKINFKELSIPLDLKGEQTQTLDLRKELGNYIYTTRSTIEDKRLAEKIYDSVGEFEFSNEERKLLQHIVESSSLTLPVKDAICNQLEV